MAAIPLKIRGLNVVLVVFALFVLGGAAAIMEQNLPTNIKIGASNIIQSAGGTLAKKGSSAFLPCKFVTTDYVLISKAPSTTCTPLTVQSSLADPLIGKQVIATGTIQNGIFYATSLKAK